ncbi:CRISPR-associated endonuclease Cas2 [Acinetobacter sichuanensis]|uniref:CRISPR-associated endonuclease Cas2 n=1 Tax=Acinetobacter sichuanensis TaxID=2136183 RepID=UPI00280E77DE|nr:CRISPR-associated endonuclease Cas2 [Acinetobacter sichuanensis]MDQ9021827.1 CRISPR-associated endonuclease Cas2 [Acinetobacter sichuanensis]
MSTKLHHWICSYDIRHPKRLKKIHQVLSMLGIAINYSVFYLCLNEQQYLKLCQNLQRLIHIDDDIRLYRCASLQTATIVGTVTPMGIYLMNAQGQLF